MEIHCIPFLLVLIMFFSCSNSDTKTVSNGFKSISIKETIQISEIDSVEMINNYGRHLVSEKNINSFRSPLFKMFRRAS